MNIKTLQPIKDQEEHAHEHAILSPSEAIDILDSFNLTAEQRIALESLTAHLARLQLVYNDLCSACDAGYEELSKQSGRPNWEVLGQLANSGDMSHFLPAGEIAEIKTGD